MTTNYVIVTGANKPKMMENTAYVSSNSLRQSIAKSTQNQHQLFLGYKKTELKKKIKVWESLPLLLYKKCFFFFPFWILLILWHPVLSVPIFASKSSLNAMMKMKNEWVVPAFLSKKNWLKSDWKIVVLALQPPTKNHQRKSLSQNTNSILHKTDIFFFLWN